jgi:hypothetical protein
VPRGAGAVPPGVVAGRGQAAQPANAAGRGAGAAGGGRGGPNPNTLRMNYGGATVTYDKTKIR